MKQITIILSLMIGLLAVTQVDAQSKKDRDSFEIQVDGLGCPFCAYGLEKKFKEFKGIKDIAIDIETGDFSFTYPAEKALTMEAVEAQVVNAGYTPNLAKITRANGTIETNEVSQNTVAANITKDELYVNGMCGMCKARIEKAAIGVEGVSNAVWDVDTKTLSVSYDTAQTSTEDIEKATAAVGHDTKSVQATDEAYANLHPCCKYERTK